MSAYGSSAVARPEPEEPRQPIPAYLEEHYWWAYVRPGAVYFWDRQWLINLVLLGNYKRLCNAILDGYGRSLPGRSLQVACAYGDITPRLAQCVDASGTLHVIDVLQVQLDNLAPKLPADGRVSLHCMDSTKLKFHDAFFDRVLLFFLMHEQPLAVRKQTLVEALRVLRPGGTITVADFARPDRLNLFCRMWTALLARLEPFAPDLWNGHVIDWLPENARIVSVCQRRFYGGFFQILTFTSDSSSDKD
jgi:ubiquinone/menaquinone biosynthesis C-methylase UbiE